MKWNDRDGCHLLNIAADQTKYTMCSDDIPVIFQQNRACLSVELLNEKLIIALDQIDIRYKS